MRTKRPTFDLRVTLLGYAGLVVLILAVLPVQHADRLPQVFVAAGLLAGVGGLLAWADRRPDLLAPALAALIVYSLSVALLRDSTGGSGGYNGLVLLPIVWSAIRG